MIIDFLVQFGNKCRPNEYKKNRVKSDNQQLNPIIF